MRRSAPETVEFAVDVTALRLIRSNRLFWRSFGGEKKDAKLVDVAATSCYCVSVMSEAQ